MKTLRDYETKIFNRVNPLVNFSVTRYVMAVGIFVAIVVFGIVSTLGLGVDLLPNIVIPAVVVRTSYPGATPSVMDLQVTQVVENVVSAISGITDINSVSSQGVSRVILTFDPSTDKYADANQVATAVSAAVKSLPASASTPTIQTFDPNAAPILQFGIAGQGADLTDVNDYVTNTLAPQLERIDGVATILVDGGPARQFEVNLNPERLRYYNLNPQDVVNAITSSALQMPIGTIVKNRTSLTFSTQNQPADISQIGETLVDSGRGIHVDQLGSVWESPSSPDYARVNGRPEVLVSVQKTTDANAVAVASSVRKALAARQPPSRVYGRDQQRHHGAHPGVGRLHLPGALHHGHRRCHHRAPVPWQAEHRVRGHSGDPDRPLRVSHPVSTRGLLVQPRLPSGAHHRDRHRGG